MFTNIFKVATIIKTGKYLAFLHIFVGHYIASGVKCLSFVNFSSFVLLVFSLIINLHLNLLCFMPKISVPNYINISTHLFIPYGTLNFPKIATNMFPMPCHVCF